LLQDGLSEAIGALGPKVPAGRCGRGKRGVLHHVPSAGPAHVAEPPRAERLHHFRHRPRPNSSIAVRRLEPRGSDCLSPGSKESACCIGRWHRQVTIRVAKPRRTASTSVKPPDRVNRQLPGPTFRCRRTDLPTDRRCVVRFRVRVRGRASFRALLKLGPARGRVRSPRLVIHLTRD
jgi:hypothetical protein